jgi:hypothetical protein
MNTLYYGDKLKILRKEWGQTCDSAIFGSRARSRGEEWSFGGSQYRESHPILFLNTYKQAGKILAEQKAQRGFDFDPN